MPRSVWAWLLRLYPAAWRERYAEEFAAMLEQGMLSPLDVVDILLGACDAHLQLFNGEDVSWRLVVMLNKLRTTLLIVFAAFIGFVVAGMALVNLVDDSLMVPLMKAEAGPALAWLFIQIGAVVALLVVVLGGLPLGITVIRRALSVDRRNLRWLMVPLVAFLALVLYIGFMFGIASGLIQVAGVSPAVQPGSFPLGNRLLLAGLMFVFISGAIASTLAVWKVVSRTYVEQATFQAGGRSLSLKIYQFAFAPAVVTSLAMLVMLIATLIWGGLVFSQLPQVFSGAYGPLLMSTRLWYFGIVTIMAVCSLAAILGLVRGRSALTAT